MNRLTLCLVLALSCTLEPQYGQMPSDAFAARELLPDGLELSPAGTAVALDTPWAAVAVAGGVQMWHLDPVDGNWSLHDLIGTPDGASGFGAMLDMHGERVVIAAPDEASGGVDGSGAAYVFSLDAEASCGQQWCLDGRIQAPNPRSSAAFSSFYGLSIHGDRLVVGARGHSNFAGAAYIFDRTGECVENWCFVQELRSEFPGLPAEYGRHVSVSADRVAVGALGPERVHVWDLADSLDDCGTPWCLTQEVAATDATFGDEFGAVALDGDTLVVGAPNAEVVYVFDRDPSAGLDVCGEPWCASGRISNPSGRTGERFGYVTDLQGRTAAIARVASGGGGAGEVLLFDERGGSWSQAAAVEALEPGTRFGYFLALDGVHLAASSLDVGSSGLFLLNPRGPGVLQDFGLDLATADNTVTSGEYSMFSTGIGESFGGVFGPNSTLQFDSDECGGLVVGWQSGNFLNDRAVLYIDSIDGEGFASTETFTDNNDPLRRAISGFDGGATRATLTFAPGFTADYAIAVDSFFAGLWKLSDSDSHEFVRGFANVPTGDNGEQFELGPLAPDDRFPDDNHLQLSHLGLAPGDSFDVVLTYLSDTAFRSNEFHGVSAEDPPQGVEHIGQNPFALQPGTFLQFRSVQPVGPATRADPLTVAEGGEGEVYPANNDSDPSGLDLESLALASPPQHGVVTVHADQFLYQHDGSETTTDRFTYTIGDSCGGVSLGIVNVAINPVNDPLELAVPDIVVTPDEEAPIELPAIVLSDPDAAGATVALSVSHGALFLLPERLTIVSGGIGSASIQFRGALADMNTALRTLSYQGSLDYNGADSLVIQASGRGILSDTPDATGTLAIDVQPVNDRPAMSSAPLWIDEGTAFVLGATVLRGTDVDDDNATLRFVLEGPPSNGTLTLGLDTLALGDSFTQAELLAGDVVYTHDGSERSWDSLLIAVEDDDGARSQAESVQMVISPVDDPLQLSVPDVVVTPDEDTSAPLPAIALSDPDASTVAVALSVSQGIIDMSTDGLTVVDGAVGSASVQVSGTIADLNTALGELSYTGAADYTGADSLVIQADGSGTLADPPEVTASLAIDVQPVDDPPVAEADAYTLDEDTTLTLTAATGLLSNDSDAEGDVMSVLVVGDVSSGSLSVDADGAFTYTPDVDFAGADSFSYQVLAGDLGGNTVAVTLTVNPINDAPMASDDGFTIDSEATLTVDAADGVLANDTDIESDPLTAAVATPPASGTLELDADGSFIYTSNAGFFGTDTFTYTASDGTDASAAATVTLEVTEPDPDPDTDDVDTDDADTEGTGADNDGGCGCATGSSPAGLLLLLPALIALRRRGSVATTTARTNASRFGNAED